MNIDDQNRVIENLLRLENWAEDNEKGYKRIMPYKVIARYASEAGATIIELRHELDELRKKLAE